MQYQEAAAALIGSAAESLAALDRLTAETSSHRLDAFEPLIRRLSSIRDDLAKGTRLGPAIAKTNELNALLVGGSKLNQPKYRSLLASLLGSYERTGAPRKAILGGLRGGRPRKDGKAKQTLEMKGYSADNLPPPKTGKTRVHPTYAEFRRNSLGQQKVPGSL